MYLKGIKTVIMIMLALLLVGCSASKKEVTAYMSDDLIKTINELESIDMNMGTYSDLLTELQSIDAMELLKKDIMPSLKKVRENLDTKYVKEKELIEFNYNYKRIIGAVLKRQEKVLTIFNEILSKEKAEQIMKIDLNDKVESVITHDNEIYEQVNRLNKKIKRLTEEYNLEWKGETPPLFTIASREKLQEKTRTEINQFVLGTIKECQNELITSKQGSNEEGVISWQRDNEINFSGSVTINDSLIVNGQTNLLPGSKIDLTIYQYGSENPYFDKKIIVNEDGSFDIEVDVPKKDLDGSPIEVQMSYYPNKGSLEEQELYGKEGANLIGPFVQKYTDHKLTKIGVFAYSYIDLTEGSKEEFVQVEHNPPEDYGIKKIWIEVDEVKMKKDYYDVKIKSNLIELTHINATLDNPGYDLAGYTSRANVSPDGSFRFQIPRLKKDNDKSFITIEAVTDFSVETEALYGKNGEHFQGDLVKETEEGQEIEFVFNVED